MNKGIKLKVEIDTTEIKELIGLIRKLKFEIFEIKKLGVSKRVLNKMTKLLIRMIVCKKD